MSWLRRRAKSCRAGATNAAGVVISWEPLEDDPSPSNVVALTEAIHPTLNTSQEHQEAQTQLRDHRHARALVHRHQPLGRADRDVVLQTRRAGHCWLAAREDASPQTAHFHRQIREKPAATLLPLRPAERFEQADSLVGYPTTGNRPSPLPARRRPANQPFSRCGRRKAGCGGTCCGWPPLPLRRTASRFTGRATWFSRSVPPLSAGRCVGVMGEFGCRTLLLTEGDWSARLRELLVGEVPRHLLLLQEAAAPLAEFRPIPRRRPLCRDCGGDAAVDRGVGTSRRHRRRVANGA